MSRSPRGLVNGQRPELHFDRKRIFRGRPPVVLLGGINVVRAFGLADIPVVVATSGHTSTAIASRYCAGVCNLQEATTPDQIVDALLRAGAELAELAQSPIPLFCGADPMLALLQDYRDVLSGVYTLSLNDRAVAEALIDKSLFHELADDRDLPVPRPMTWGTLQDFECPILVKPKTNSKGHPLSHEAFFGRAAKARVFESGPAVLRDPLAQQLSGDLIFQEFIPGDDRSLWSFHGFADETGQLLEWFIGRKIRTYPALTGQSSYLELAHDDELAEMGAAIVGRVPLKGMFKIDFKRSAVTRKLYMLEVNARCNLWLYLGARNGVNLARIAYDYLTAGIRPEHAVSSTDYRWLSLHLDYQAYRQLAASGQLTAAQWLWSLTRSRKIYSLLSWSDPAPFASHVWQRAASIPDRIRRLF